MYIDIFVYRSVEYFHFATINGDGDQFHPKPIVAGIGAPAIKNTKSLISKPCKLVSPRVLYNNNLISND